MELLHTQKPPKNIASDQYYAAFIRTAVEIVCRVWPFSLRGLSGEKSSSRDMDHIPLGTISSLARVPTFLNIRAYTVYVLPHHHRCLAQLLIRFSFTNRATRYQVLVMLVTIWLAEWSRQTFDEQQRTHYLTILVLLTLAAIMVSLLRAVITFASLVTVGGYTRISWVLESSVLYLPSDCCGSGELPSLRCFVVPGMLFIKTWVCYGYAS